MVTAEDIDDMDFELPSEPQRTPQPSTSHLGMPAAAGGAASQQEHRDWPAFYPIYIDAKASKPHRRVPKSKAVPWPTAYMMARECARLGLRTHLEAGKCHPADWANPGRVRVQLEQNGRFAHPTIRTKRKLLDALAKAHPHLDPSSPIYERLAQNSPLYGRGIIEEAIANPQAMLPPGMEGFTPPAGGAQTPPASSAKGKETASGFPTGKQKKKVIHVRR